jgi:RimJ/RimL family protein N-acetyltransferase
VSLPEEGEVASETERLRFRTFRAADLGPMAAMNADPKVMEFLGGSWSAEKTAAVAQEINAAWAARGRGMLAVERRSDGAFLGMAGLTALSWFPQDVEVGWRLLPAFWGQGYASEAGRAWIGWGFARHGPDRIISVADVPNRRSRAVMERLGMRLWREMRLWEGDDEFDAVVYEVRREDWV